jgi:Rhomboid family
MLPLSSAAAASSSNNEQPSPPNNNPILTVYEGWYHNTPFVTRSILSIQLMSYLVSWFIGSDLINFALANIPHFILSPHYEIYRLLTSPYLVNTSLLSLIFTFLSFNEQGKRLEYSLGSTRFVILCIAIGVITNIIFLLLSIVMFYAHGGGDAAASHVLLSSASGIWLVLFGIIAMECVQAPAGTQRKLFLFQVPVLYYPIALLLFFTFISASFSLGYCISMAVGYLYGFGYLNRIQLSHGKATEWEDGGSSGSSSNGGSSSSSYSSLAAALTRRDGWVSCHAATGSDAWIESASTVAGSGGGGSASGGGMVLYVDHFP